MVLSLALSGLGHDALKVAGGLGLAVMIALAFSSSSLTPFTSVAAPEQAVISAHTDEMSADQEPVMRQAVTICGPPWQVLAAVAKSESDFGPNIATSSAEAIGCRQFLSSAKIGPVTRVQW